MAHLLPRLQAMGVDPGRIPATARAARKHRVTAIRGAGNAIVPQLAAEFILAYFPLTPAQG